MYPLRVQNSVDSWRLDGVGGVLIEGVRRCGKTETGRHHAASEVTLYSPSFGVRMAWSLIRGFCLTALLHA